MWLSVCIAEQPQWRNDAKLPPPPLTCSPWTSSWRAGASTEQRALAALALWSLATDAAPFPAPATATHRRRVGTQRPHGRSPGRSPRATAWAPRRPAASQPELKGRGCGGRSLGLRPLCLMPQHHRAYGRPVFGPTHHTTLLLCTTSHNTTSGLRPRCSMLELTSTHPRSQLFYFIQSGVCS
eukprot:COSAG01_NODE_272_length_19747_cov_298.524023_11_plen_182_part_00